MITINRKAIAAAGTTAENEPIIKSDGAGEVMQWQPSDGEADGIFITEGGSAGDPLRLGVGDATPTELLEIAGSSDPTLLIRHNTADQASSGKISFRESAGGTTGADLRYDGAANNFIIDTSDVSNALVIARTTGNVSIGGAVTVDETAISTTNSCKLEVRSTGNSATSAIRATNKDVTAGTNQAASYDFGLSRNSGAFKPQAGKISVGRSDDWTSDDAKIDAYMAFSVYENNALSEKLRISSAGNVGVGTDAPKRNLHVYNPTDTGSGVGQSTYIQVTNLSTGKGTDGDGFQLGLNNAGEAQVNQRENLDMIFSTNNAERLRIASGGTVTFSPIGNNKSIVIDTPTATVNPIVEVNDCNSLTDGNIMYLRSDSSNTNTRSLVKIHNDHESATGTTGLEVRNDSTGKAIYANGGGIVEKDGVLKENLLSNSGFDVWSNSTLCNPTTGAASVLGDAGDLITDGTFSDTANWPTQNTGWAVTGGQAVATSAASSYAVGQTIAATVVGKLYQVQIVVSGRNSVGAGGIYIHQFDGVSSSPTIIADGTHTFTCEMLTAYTSFQIRASGTTTLDVDSVTFHEITVGCVADNALGPDGWWKTAGPIDVLREHDGAKTKDGSYYSCKIIGNGLELGWSGGTPDNAAPTWLAKVQGRTLTFGVWAWADTASQTRIYFRDSVTGYTYSSYHSGGSGWEWIEVTGSVASAATFAYVAIEGGTEAAWISQPMLVFGSAIGAGNYSRPMGEIVWCESGIPSNKFNGVSGFSDTAATLLNAEADSNGKIPKGAKAISVQMYGRDSASASTQCNVTLGGTSATADVACNASGAPNDANVQSTGWTSCDANGDYYYYINATGSGTWDFYNNYTYRAVQLR